MTDLDFAGKDMPGQMATLLRVTHQVLAEKSLEGLLQRITNAARELTRAKSAIAVYGYRDGNFLIRTSSHCEKANPAPPGTTFAIRRGGVYMDLVRGAPSVRFTDEELRRHPAWWGLPEGHGPVRGLLGARLADTRGETSGLVMVSDREDGDFTPEDEALLVQLAAIASLGLQHIEARTEAERRAEELDRIFESMVEAVVVYDQQGMPIRANQAAVSSLGFDPVGLDRAELVRRVDLHHADGRPVSLDSLASSSPLRGSVVSNRRLVLKSPADREDTVIEASSAPLWEDGSIRGAVAVWHDVTERFELERQKEQFIAVAAHELKTPLAILKGHAQALIRKAADVPPERRRLVDAIERGVDRADSIVEDLLDLSRLQAGQIQLRTEPLDLVTLLSDVVDRMALTTDRHELRLSSTGPVPVEADPARIEQVFAALLDNAIRYTPRGGTIDVRVRTRGNVATVSVSDPGVGIPQERQARIFERFYRAHTGTVHDYGGMGVALYIAREVVSRHGGRMCFVSKEGAGSTFHFTLPLGGANG